MNTKELIANIEETKNRMRVCVSNLNSNFTQDGVLEGPVTEEPYTSTLSKLNRLTASCILEIHDLDKLCKYLENLSEEEKEKEL